MIIEKSLNIVAKTEVVLIKSNVSLFHNVFKSRMLLWRHKSSVYDKGQESSALKKKEGKGKPVTSEYLTLIIACTMFKICLKEKKIFTMGNLPLQHFHVTKFLLLL